jgi:hypothetical protein
MWENGHDEEKSHRLIETVIKSNGRNKLKKHGPRAKPEQKPLGMNQEDSEPEI